MSWTSQRATLAALRAGSLTTIVCTAVLAEGLDVPHVATIVLTDGAASPTAYVQARGRARDVRAWLLWLVPRGDLPSLDGLPGRTVAASMALARRGAVMMERALDSRGGGGRWGDGEAADDDGACGGGRGGSGGDGTPQNPRWATTSDMGLGGSPPEPTSTVYSNTTRARVNIHSCAFEGPFAGRALLHVVQRACPPMAWAHTHPLVPVLTRLRACRFAIHNQCHNRLRHSQTLSYQHQ